VGRNGRVPWGVTVEEFERAAKLEDRQLAEHTGVSLDEKIEDAWRVTTIRKK